jgi:hypothetical protein
VGDIRRQYAEHTFMVEGGSVPHGLPGVRSCEPMNGGVKLTLERTALPADVLRALLDRGVAVSSFAPVIPPLEDIFVHVVTTGVGLDKGRSGPPTVDEPLALGGVR